MKKDHYLQKLFYPRTVTIVGAGDNPLSVNGRSLMFMLRHKSTARIYPVNPNRDSVQGIPCYRRITDLPEVPDVAVIVVGKALVLSALEELGQRGCPFAIVNTSGYAETGARGVKDQDDLVRTASRYGMRLMGPNCLGLINLLSPVILSWCATLEREPGDLLPGDVAMISQSGAMLGSIWDRAMGLGLGYCHLLSSGNEADLRMADFMDYFAQDDHTRVVTGFVEALRDPEKFLGAVDRAHANGKSVVLYKVGRTAAGKRAAVSHTGSLTGSDDTFDAICRAHGIVRADTLDALMTTAMALRAQPPARGGRLGIFCCSGGAAGLMADQMRGKGLSVAPVSPEFERDMTEITDFQPPHNPLDIIKGPLKSYDVIREAMKRFAREESFEQIIILMTTMYLQKVAPKLMLEGLRGGPEKPVLACWLGDKVVEKPSRELIEGGVVTYHDVDSCLDAARALSIVGRHRQRLERTLQHAELPRDARKRALAIIESCEGRLDEVSSKAILSLYGFPIPRGKVARTLDEARDIAGQLGFPVVVKGISPELIHKTEAGVVYTGIGNEKDLAEAFGRVNGIIASTATPRGVLIEEMLPQPVAELIMGCAFEEPCFQKIIFGLGGIWVEALEDVSIRLAPIVREDAEEMISEIRGKKLLEGMRGKPPADKEALVSALISLSTLMTDLRDQIREIDVNPLMVFQKGAVAVDAILTLRSG
ncbi:MAG TPA: acetate--CoA ligase family protein [Syntrophales bacterium]|nr:acetate--CoA ligase family protein [Syntrophales bacterium]HOX95014.1 acetate--CoA ligase family protein [Syntrophales bacterium]HPI58225.1 acetate--CoA ligase family protein [Syntrophales bacterium]HPN25591.1 acetate--CoA ligase family protein [Syntrophales bacterium]HQM28151.1 acetate--CoA ligase family protein [Syntrophales bacterium]